MTPNNSQCGHGTLVCWTVGIYLPELLISYTGNNHMLMSQSGITSFLSPK